MSFKPQGMQNSFVRTNTTSNPNQRRRIIDRLVTIDSYDLGARQINCIGSDGTRLIVSINPEIFQQNLQRAQKQNGTKIAAPKWEGYLIDNRMAEHLPIGHKIVLERAEEVRTIQHNGASAKIVHVARILNVSDPSPQKTFEGLFSISTYKSNIFHVQSWERKGILVDDTVNIERIQSALQDGADAFRNKVLKPHYGVQFRVVAPMQNSDKNECMVIDTSPHFDWVSKEVDGNGQEIKPGYPLDGEKFREWLFDGRNGYLAYVNSKFTETQYPGRFVEVCPYINYRAGPASRYMVIPERTYDPLYKLAHTQTRIAIDDDSFIQGKNLAVLGVLQLSADKADMTTRSFIARNIAVRLHAYGPMGHVHAWVRTHDDRKTTPHEALKQVAVNKAMPGEKTSSNPVQNPAQSSGPMNSASQASQPNTFESSNPMDTKSSFEDWDDFDSFSDEDPSAAALRKKLEEAKNGFNE